MAGLAGGKNRVAAPPIMMTLLKLTATGCQNCDNFRLAICMVVGHFGTHKKQARLHAMKINILFRFLALLVALNSLAASTTQAQVLLQENFTFTGPLTSNGWTAVSGTGSNASSAAAPGLTYSNLPSSGVGNAASLTTSGEDDRKQFGTTNTTGDIYASFLVNLSAAQATGDYFFTIGTGASTFTSRIFARSSGAGFQLGVQKSSTTPATYATNVYTLGTTYLVALKVTRAAGSGIASLWVDPPLGASETAPLVQNSAGSDPGSIDSVYLRQGSAGNAPTLRLGNILVGTTWVSVTPLATTAPSITSFTPSSGLVGDTVTINGINFGTAPGVKFNSIAAASSVNPAGTQITATVPSGATTGPITVEVAGEPTATSATNFTVIAPGTPILKLSTHTIAGLNATAGSPSVATNYTVTGTNLGVTPVTITPDSALLEVGTNGTNFASTLDLTPSGGTVSNTIFLRVVATNVVTNYSALVSHVSGSASNSLSVSGAITNPAPALVLNPTNLTGFTATVEAPSASQTFTVTGSNLTNNVTVTAPTGFEVASDGLTWSNVASLAQVAGSASGTISVRMAATNVFGARSGSVTAVSTSLTNRVSVSGSIPVPNIPGQVYWNFDTNTPTTGTGGDYSSWTFGPLTQNNNNGTNTPLLNATSASSGYTNPFNVLASGTNNAGAAARTGALVPEAGATNGSAFFQVEIVVPSSTTTSITNISFGSRSTGTGPAAFSIRSSADDFAADAATNSLGTNSTWAMYSASVSIALSSGTNTLRIYGYNGAGNPTANTANWRIDDLTLALGTGTGPTPPSGLSYTPSSVSGVVGTAITNMVPTVTGTVTNYSVSPTLPAGLSINPTSGVISGAPTAAAASASYTVTASNAGGSTTASVTIAAISAYDAWATSYSLAGADALPAADPDKDGLNNNLEYAFGTNPTVSNASLLSATTTSGNMTVTWIERDSGFTYAVQSTDNLATAPFVNDGTVTVSTSGSQAGVPTGYTRKQFTVPASNNKFFRVRATPN